MSRETSLIEAERRKSSFPIRKLTFLLDGDLSEKTTQELEKARDIIANDPKLNLDDIHFLSRTERYKRIMSIVKRLRELKEETGLPYPSLRRNIPVSLPTDLHDIAFLPYLKSQGSDATKAKFEKLAENYGILGAYAQTEMAHGSNVRGLETTATYLPQSQEFEIHTPQLSATKWWPGNMGRNATHVIVIAQLVLGTENKGVHAFLVPVRDKDHRPLPGISLGDIGPSGYLATDNGYLRFDKVRIPRENLFSRFANVTERGEYIKAPNDKLAYLGMLSVRAGIIQSAGSVLAKAVTVAVRYSSVRCQFGSEGKSENQILDYKMQQYRIFPEISTSIALTLTGFWMKSMFENLMGKIDQGNLQELPEVHATSSGLKSLTTTLCGDGVEICRKACGGHGFAASGGLLSLYQEYVGVQTAEGENFILTQQTARYLLKTLQNVMSGGKSIGSVAYFNDAKSMLNERCDAKDVNDLLNPSLQLRAYEHRAVRVVSETALSIQNSLQKGKTFEEAWNAAQVEAYRCSKAHCFLTLLRNFVSKIEQLKTEEPELVPILTKLCNLFGLYYMEIDIGEFVEDGYLSSKQVSFVRQKVRELLDELRNESVSLVDSFNFSGYTLASCLGTRDGDYINRLYKWVQKEPANQTAVPEGFEEVVKHIFEAGRSKL